MSSLMRRLTLVAILAVLGLAWGSPGVRAAPAAQADEKCVVEGDKVASPARVRLGETVQIRLTLTPKCPEASYRAVDVVLVIDRSRSMAGSKMSQALKAAATFVDTLDLSLQRVAVVSFDDIAWLDIGLSQDPAAIKAALNKIALGSGTNISAGLDMAFLDLLEPQGRPEALPVIVLMSDGAPNRPGNASQASVAAQVSANTARLGGATIFTIGLGSDADETLMKRIAGSDANYTHSPSEDQLEEIYRSIALQVGDFALRDLILDDDLYKDVTLVAGSANPAPLVNGKRLSWTQALVPSTGLTWVYEVQPQKLGTYPTNDRALATFTHSDGASGSFVFPQPQITVVEREKPPAACGARDMWTLMLHAFPDEVGVSALGQGCNNRFDAGDWPGGTKDPLPPLMWQLTDAEGTDVLFEGQAVPGPGRVDQRLYLRICEPPPYRLRLLTRDLNGWEACTNSPTERIIDASDFKRSAYRRSEQRFGFIRAD